MTRRRDSTGLSPSQVALAHKSLELVLAAGLDAKLDELARRLLGVELFDSLTSRHPEALTIACGFFVERVGARFSGTDRAHELILAREWVRALRYVARDDLSEALRDEVRARLASRWAAHLMSPPLDADGVTLLRQPVDAYAWASATGALRDASSSVRHANADALEALVETRLSELQFGLALLYWLGKFICDRDREMQRLVSGGVFGYAQMVDRALDRAACLSDVLSKGPE